MRISIHECPAIADIKKDMAIALQLGLLNDLHRLTEQLPRNGVCCAECGNFCEKMVEVQFLRNRLLPTKAPERFFLCPNCAQSLSRDIAEFLQNKEEMKCEEIPSS